MRIVQLANFYSPTSGGLRTCLDEIGRRYEVAGHDRVLVVPGPRDGDEQTAAGRRVVLRSPLVPGLGGYRLLVRRGTVLEMLDRLRPDVLEVSDKITLPWLAPWARRRGIPVVLFSHERIDAMLASYTPGWFPAQACADRLNRRLVPMVARIVVASAYARAEFDRVQAPNVRVVPLGVDLDLFRPAGTPRPAAGRSVLMVMAVRLFREKRPELGIEALRLSRAAGHSAGLLVVGDGPMRAELERLARGLPVRFLGHVPDRRGVAHLLAAADVALAPCPGETFGLAVLEALACGTPVVVPGGGAAPELVGPPESGVVTDGTAEGLAAGVSTLLDLPIAHRRAASREQAERFPWSATVAGLLAAHGQPERVALAAPAGAS